MQVELVSETQHESVIDLLCELFVHYNDGAVVSRDLVRAHLIENLLGPSSSQRLVVASASDGAVTGLAAIALDFSLIEPTGGKNKHCQMKELYVRASDRGNGIGRLLMAWVAKYAIEHGCCRIDWPVKESNTKGIAFYSSIGAEHVSERLAYRLTGANLSRLAG